MRKAAFSLIELLIVLVIITILTKLAIPRFTSYKQRAYVMAMLSDAHNIISAEEVYYSETDNYTDPYTLSKDALSGGVDFVSHGTGTCSNGMPGYYFSLKHSKVGSKFVNFKSCTDKAPWEGNSTISSVQ